MKSVLISIQPKWCQLIAEGKKTIEVRKTRPKMNTPFKCYIYCTKSNKEFLQSRNNILFYCENRDFIGGHGVGFYQRLNGKVIGEFVCDKVQMSLVGYNEKGCPSYWDMLDGSCLTPNELVCYGGWKILYGWHISDLVIYDRPKELSEFYRWTDYDDSKNDKRPCSYCEYNAFDYSENCEYCSIDYDGEHCIHLQMKRPPQSWCYVEELR